MKPIKLIFLFALITSCNSPRAVYDYDQAVPFETIGSYQIFPDFKSGLSQLDEQRLLKVLETELISEGLSVAENPDIFVNFYSSEYQTASQNSIGVGVGGGGGNVGMGVSGGFPIGGPETYLKLTFDFIDVEKDNLIWQAIVESRFNKNSSPEERENQLRLMVEKALKGFPPKK